MHHLVHTVARTRMTPAFPVGRISRLLGATACAILLTACAATKPELAQKPPVPTMDELLAKANEASTAGEGRRQGQSQAEGEAGHRRRRVRCRSVRRTEITRPKQPTGESHVQKFQCAEKTAENPPAARANDVRRGDRRRGREQGAAAG